MRRPIRCVGPSDASLAAICPPVCCTGQLAHSGFGQACAWVLAEPWCLRLLPPLLPTAGAGDRGRTCSAGFRCDGAVGGAAHPRAGFKRRQLLPRGDPGGCEAQEAQEAQASCSASAGSSGSTRARAAGSRRACASAQLAVDLVALRGSFAPRCTLCFSSSSLHSCLLMACGVGLVPLWPCLMSVEMPHLVLYIFYDMLCVPWRRSSPAIASSLD